MSASSKMGSVSTFDAILPYPITRRDESVVDNYHGIMIPDPYRWVEDPDSEETKEFMEKQMRLTDSVLKTCKIREKLRERLTELYDFPKYNAPFRAADKYFYLYNTGLQPQTVLYVQVFVSSKDGTKIPMFIVAKKGIHLDGSHLCLLYGYGGFNYSIMPEFKGSRIVLAKHLDVVYCSLNIRGGGEYGVEWHKGGSLAKKQNCYDDFISAAEFLVSAGYTQPSKLCIEGESNGGLLVGACINQRPDLFGCALAHVGVMDMLRFQNFTIGHEWTSEYGCSDNEEEFRWLIKYSPLHNITRPWNKACDKGIQYPSTMLLTADHDDRVVPLHSLKLLATMQHVLCTSLKKSPQIRPIIGRIEKNAGHGPGMPTQKVNDEAADTYAFMAKVIGASWID